MDSLATLFASLSLVGDKKEKEKEEESTDMEIDETVRKGQKCSISGTNYELRIQSVLNEAAFEGRRIVCNGIGGSSGANDVSFAVEKLGTIGIEAKKSGAPDWMQCSLYYDQLSQTWSTQYSKGKTKIPKESCEIFDNIIGKQCLWQGRVPSFMSRKVTYEEWMREKSDFMDTYIECDRNTIRDLYMAKGCQYIQVEGKGVYRLGEDKLGMEVPEFICDQRIRVRVKVHTRCDKNGYAVLSVKCACQPMKSKIPDLPNSCYSLDNTESLPPSLRVIVI